MSAQQGLNLLVFRPGHRQVFASGLKSELLKSLRPLASVSSREAVTSALLRSGELECSLADAGWAALTPFANLTDCLADTLVQGSAPHFFSHLVDSVAGAAVPEQVSLTTPEGFAYYALHPLAYADVLDKLPALPPSVLVVGIRSIGSTLSAVTAATVRLRGRAVRRITVRPDGHPYNRQTEFPLAEHALIRDAVSSSAAFLVVDEGPGLSGSSFLSVAEALEKAGAPPEKIILLCGHEPNLQALCSTDAARRWARFRHMAVGGAIRRSAAAEQFVGAGQWRNLLFQNEPSWSESWTRMERLKYLSAGTDRKLFKFAGLGHYGEAVFDRERAIAAAGFGPEPQRESDGFVSYPWIEGHPMSSQDLSAHVLARLAEYCAFRSQAFPSTDAAPGALQEMAGHNLCELKFNLTVDLKIERTVITDGRMHPHEWLLTSEGRILKTDCGSHGDDHFFPGPTDIAWDLAGAIVEWHMNELQAKTFLDMYCRASGDDAANRIADFIHAYAVFRCAYCKMAANAMQGSPEQIRMEQAATTYAALLPQYRAASGL
ncbi:MAG TPA: hypothetical protein VE133_17985 [Candidatus Sulfotelmatobacter sp.]|nr:hypothetical protein [Candidatus Sulfotelmatobacter sp.]